MWMTYEWNTNDAQNNYTIEMSTCYWRYHCFSLVYLKPMNYWFDKKSCVNFCDSVRKEPWKNVKEIFKYPAKLEIVKEMLKYRFKKVLKYCVKYWFYHLYVLVCTRMSSVCTRMSFVCHSYVLLCHSYVTGMWL